MLPIQVPHPKRDTQPALSSGDLGTPPCAKFLEQSHLVITDQRVDPGAHARQVSSLTEGYCHIRKPSRCGPGELRRLIDSLIQVGKTLVVDDDGDASDVLPVLLEGDPRRRIIGFDREDRAHDCQSSLRRHECTRWFILPDAYLARQLSSRRARERAVIDPRLAALTQQQVRFVSVPVGREPWKPAQRTALARARAVIAFEEVSPRVESELCPQVDRFIVIPYDPQSYATNVARVNRALADLHIDGILEVAVLVEGSPQVFDLADQLSLFGRRFHFVESSMPMAVRLCHAFGQRYGLNLLDPGYVLCSGFFQRYGYTSGDFGNRLRTYLELPLTSVLSEMYQADTDLSYAMIQRYDKHLLVFENMLTPTQKLHFIQAGRGDLADQIGSLAGKLVTFVIIDKRTLSATAPLQQLAASWAPSTKAREQACHS